jgi:drug/metabolite transporter superfamily protein YnfA
MVKLGAWGQLGVMTAAAMLEVGGDILIRKGLRGSGLAVVVLGFLVLGSYGVIVNLLEIDFTRLLGAYMGVFALLSVSAGRVFFRDVVSNTTWSGLLLVVFGSLVIQFGNRAS